MHTAIWPAMLFRSGLQRALHIALPSFRNMQASADIAIRAYLAFQTFFHNVHTKKCSQRNWCVPACQLFTFLHVLPHTPQRQRKPATKAKKRCRVCVEWNARRSRRGIGPCQKQTRYGRTAKQRARHTSHCSAILFLRGRRQEACRLLGSVGIQGYGQRPWRQSSGRRKVLCCPL